jgi:acetamidase/formamidase
VKSNPPLHTLHQHQSHLGWNKAYEPVLRLTPGETVDFQVIDASDGQLTQSSTAADILRFDFNKVNPVVGPIYLDGAEPGDAIKVTLQSFAPSGWGWTGVVPGFGLLADQFPHPALHVWKYDPDTLSPAMYGPGGRVPLKPFCGTVLRRPKRDSTASSRRAVSVATWTSATSPRGPNFTFPSK